MPIYIKEDAYGVRHSKYAANYRNKWQDAQEKDSESLSPLPIGHNVATFKLVERTQLTTDTKNTAKSWEELKGKKSEGKVQYITLPSLKRESKEVKFSARQLEAIQMAKKYKVSHSHIKGFQEHPDADYHSEQTIGNQLREGYRKISNSNTTLDNTATHHEKITGGKYWIKWIYTERIPCDGSRYKKPCDQYIEQLERDQIAAGGPPITVFYKKTARNFYQAQFNTTQTIGESEKKNQYKKEITEGVNNIEGHVLSKNPELAAEHEENLISDVNLGFQLKYFQQSDIFFNAATAHWQHIQNQLTQTLAALKANPNIAKDVIAFDGIPEQAEKLNQHCNNLISRLDQQIAAAKILEKQYITLYSDKAISKNENMEFPISNFIADLQKMRANTINQQAIIGNKLAADIQFGIAAPEWPPSVQKNLEGIQAGVDKFQPEKQLGTLKNQFLAIKNKKADLDLMKQQQETQQQQENQMREEKKRDLFHSNKSELELDTDIEKLKEQFPPPILSSHIKNLSSKERKEYTLLKLQKSLFEKEKNKDKLQVCQAVILEYENKAKENKANEELPEKNSLKRFAEQSQNPRPIKKLQTENEESEISMETVPSKEANNFISPNNPNLAKFEKACETNLNFPPLLNQLAKSQTFKSHDALQNNPQEKLPSNSDSLENNSKEKPSTPFSTSPFKFTPD